MAKVTTRTRLGLLAAVVVTAAATSTATTAVATHQFADVATGSFFHDEIAAIFDAGCAGGYGDGTFRPSNPTTRGQFTYWLNNCGGRVAFANDGPKTLSGGAQQDLATAVMTAGALPTGGGFVVAVASLSGSSAGCATVCVVEYRLFRDGNASPTETAALTLGENQPSAGSLQTVFPVAGGSDTTLRLAAARTAGASAVEVEGSLTLLYVPFAGDGTGGGQESTPG